MRTFATGIRGKRQAETYSILKARTALPVKRTIHLIISTAITRSLMRKKRFKTGLLSTALIRCPQKDLLRQIYIFLIRKQQVLEDRAVLFFCSPRPAFQAIV